MYSNQCGCESEHTLRDLGDAEDWDKIYTDLAQQLLDGNEIETNQLYKKIAGQLVEALHSGLGGSSFPVDDTRTKLADVLNLNLYDFSMAKTLFQIQHYRDLMIGDDGKLLPFSSFKKLVADQGEIFNQQYMKVEYDMTVQSAIMAHKWDTLDSEYLQFTTVGDSRVRPEHKLFDKFTALKSDPIWKRLYTPLSWGCRCTVIPGKASKVDSVYDSKWANAMVDPLVKGTIFDNNVGISKVIFNKNHPYFKVKK